jgi:hypothetical protein
LPVGRNNDRPPYGLNVVPNSQDVVGKCNAVGLVGLADSRSHVLVVFESWVYTTEVSASIDCDRGRRNRVPPDLVVRLGESLRPRRRETGAPRGKTWREASKCVLTAVRNRTQIMRDDCNRSSKAEISPFIKSQDARKFYTGALLLTSFRTTSITIFAYPHSAPASIN